MARKFLLPVLAAIIIIAMVIPGCDGAPTTYALTMAVSPVDTGTATDVTGTSPYAKDTEVDIKAVPEAGYYFINWSAPAGTFADENAAETKFTMPAAAVTVTANFDVLPEGHYSLTLVATPLDGGTAIDVAAVGHYLEGSDVSIYGKCTWGYYTFDVWTSDPAVTFVDDGDATTAFTMPSAHVTVTASFVAQGVELPYYDFIFDEYAARGLGNFTAEINPRMQNLYDFGAAKGHYWVGAGPMYLEAVYPLAKTLQLTRFADYPDQANKFTELLLGKTGPARAGAWVNTVTIERVPDEPTGVSRLLAGDYHIYVQTLSDSELYDAISDDPNYWMKDSFGSWNTLRPNFYGPEFTTGTLNPFYDFDVLAAWQKLIDRDHIALGIMGGMAVPRYVQTGILSGDRMRYLNDPLMTNNVLALEAQYAYCEGTLPGLGLYEFRERVLDLNGKPGVTKLVTYDAGTNELRYDGTQIEVKVAIRSDDPQRNAIGDYIGSQLELAGFKFTPVYGDMATILSPIVNNKAKIEAGDWTFYTGGWVSTVIARDDGDMFYWFHTDGWKTGIPAFAYLPGIDWDEWDLGNPQAEPFLDAAADLIMLNFDTMDERRDMFDIALGEHMRRGMIYLIDSLGFTGLSNEVDVAADLSGGVYGSWMWAFTVHFTDGGVPTGNPTVGGDLKVALFDLLVEPWNPVAGSNTVYDMFPLRATGDMAHHPDTSTGLRLPGRLEKADVYVPVGTPSGVTEAWVTLDMTKAASDPVFIAPDTAWGSWDAANQKVVTVGERFAANPDRKVGSRVSVAYYPTGTLGHPLHDGNEVSFADFLYYWILQYDRGMTESGIYDETRVVGLGSLHSDVIGVEFDTDVPGYDLVVTTWSNVWQLDAELMVTGWWPNYAQGNGFWHPLALAALAEADGLCAFGEVKAANEGKAWMSFITGDGLIIMGDYLEAFLGV
ncbi:MAG: hypothetical protein KAY24_16025 [Candidatus Eisenbacteria sp.]|nr:hypothetical protein [Candidatus Eisenbacteria bacterium]